MYYIAVKYLNEPILNVMSEEYFPLIYPRREVAVQWRSVSKRVSKDFHRQLQRMISGLIAQGLYTMLDNAGNDLFLKPVKYKVDYLNDGGIEIRIRLEVK